MLRRCTPFITFNASAHVFLDGDSSMSKDDDLNDHQESSSSSPGPLLSNCFTSSHQLSLCLAKKTYEMVFYRWFSSNSPSPCHHQFVPHSSPHTASLQFSISPHFIQFMQKVLKTTQVSQSIIILSLHYIYRLEEQISLTSNPPGSRFRFVEYVLIPFLLPCSF